MKKHLVLFLAACFLPAAAFGEKIDLGSGRTVHLTVPGTWTAGELPAPPPGLPVRGQSLRCVTKSGSNDSVMLTFVTVPDDRLADREVLKGMAEDASQQFVAGSVEGKADLREFKIGLAAGYSVTFTDASLVGQPAIKEDYKAMTSYFVYLGDRVLLSATIFSDDVKGPAYAEAVRLLKSVTLQLPSQQPI